MRIKSSIFIDNLRLHAFHGVMEQEGRVGADFAVSLRVHYNIYKAMTSDEVADTISYAELYELVKREMAKPSALLEHVAGRMAQAVISAFPQTEAVDIRLTKVNPPMGALCDGAGVELHVVNEQE